MFGPMRYPTVVRVPRQQIPFWMLKWDISNDQSIGIRDRYQAVAFALIEAESSYCVMSVLIFWCRAIFQSPAIKDVASRGTVDFGGSL